MRSITLWRGGVLVAMALGLSACAGGGGSDRIEVASHPQLPPADYLTQSDQFASLQEAALSADYAAFAQHLHAGDPQAVVAQLQDAFAGAPFDLYTLDAETGRNGHRRVAELRGPSGRLYLYLELDRAEGGWNVERYELGRDRDSALARL
jgi:hypothetical protein